MKYPILLFICASLLLQGCKSFVSPSEVNPFFEPEAYNSFGIEASTLLGTAREWGADEQEQLLKLIRREMRSRRYIESPEPDIWIQLQLELEERKLSDQPFPNENKWENLLGVPKHIRTGELLAGVLEITVVDSQTTHEVWKGREKILIEKSDSKKELKQLKTEVKALLKTFPYRAQKIRLVAPS